MNPSEAMFLLPYHVRDDADARGYDDWLRSTDNPFFNAQPEIVHYTNWKIARRLGLQGGYTHLDLMFVPSVESADTVWASEEIARFARGWQELWAPDPSADLSCCVSILLCRQEEATAATVRTNRLLFTPGPPGTLPAQANASRWRVAQTVVGGEDFEAFTIRYLDGEPEPGATGAVCDLIASPDFG